MYVIIDKACLVTFDRALEPRAYALATCTDACMHTLHVV